MFWRRRLLNSSFCILHSAFLLTVSCATLPPTPAPTRFKILQLNDVYKIEGLEGGQSGGLARVRTLRKHLESDGTPVLVLHAGDALYPSVMSKYLEAKPMVEVLNLLDGDAKGFDERFIITFGNHEFDKSDPKILLARMAESQFLWVASNTLQCNPTCTEPFPDTRQTLLFDAGGTRVGVFGLVYPMQKPYMQSTAVAGAAKRAVDELRGQGARVVIAVTHEDMPDDEKLVQQVPGIDLVIGGHDHLFLQNQVNGTWITKADADAKSVIVYDVTVPATGRVSTTPLRVTLDTTIAKDATVDKAVQGWLCQLAAKLGGDDTIGMTKNLLEGVEPAVRGRETALGNLLADVALEQMQTDIAVVGGGGIRINDNIPPGPITKYHMEGVFYYPNRIVAFTGTGQQILEMLRHSVSRADSGDGRFLQVSGVRFKYHPRDGRFIVNAEDVEIKGRPLDVNARYTVAITEFLYLHGSEDDKYELFTDANRPPKFAADREADFREKVEAYIRTRKTIETAIDGRIQRVEPVAPPPCPQ